MAGESVIVDGLRRLRADGASVVLDNDGRVDCCCGPPGEWWYVAVACGPPCPGHPDSPPFVFVRHGGALAGCAVIYNASTGRCYEVKAGDGDPRFVECVGDFPPDGFLCLPDGWAEADGVCRPECEHPDCDCAAPATPCCQENGGTCGLVSGTVRLRASSRLAVVAEEECSPGNPDLRLYLSPASSASITDTYTSSDCTRGATALSNQVTTTITGCGDPPFNFNDRHRLNAGHVAGTSSQGTTAGGAFNFGAATVFRPYLYAVLDPEPFYYDLHVQAYCDIQTGDVGGHVWYGVAASLTWSGTVAAFGVPNCGGAMFVAGVVRAQGTQSGSGVALDARVAFSAVVRVEAFTVCS